MIAESGHAHSLLLHNLVSILDFFNRAQFVCKVVQPHAVSLRRRGVATALWREGILPFCRDAGFRHVGHFVMAHNERAIAFYENLGFRICGRHDKLVDWDGELLDAVEMEMWLEAEA